MAEENIFSYQEPLNNLRSRLEGVLSNYSSESALVDNELRAIQDLYKLKVNNLKPQIMMYGIYNAGKSSVINALIGKDVAKVADIPTTDNVDLYQWNEYEIADTPGIEAPIEDEMVTEEHLRRADVVLFVMSNTGSHDKASNYERMKKVDRSGKQLVKYRKMHLFDSDLPELRSHESETFGQGNSIAVFDTEFGRMGVAVCFDVRFPELIRTLSQRGAELVFIPAQFNYITGPKHWEMLLRARAIDNQIYMAGCCAALDESIHWHSWGHSLVADPLAEIICEGGSGEEIVYADIDLNRVDEARRELPVCKLLRRDMYKVSD